MRRLGLAAYVAWFLHRVAQAIQPHPLPTAAQLRQVHLASTRLQLEQNYHPARAGSRYVLIPKDRYFHQAESVLKNL